MKNNIKYLVIFLLLGLFVISCKKKEDNTTDLASLSFANKTVNQSKTDLENAGSQMVGEMQTLESGDGIKVVSSFSNLTNTSDPFSTTKSALLTNVKNTSQLTSATTMFGYLRAGVQESTDTTLEQVFTTYKGVYTWNFTSKKWNKTTATDRIEFDFPSTKTGTTNNAKMVITYQGIKGVNLIKDYHGDMPAKFDNSIYVNGTLVAEYNLTATYNSDGTPSSVVYFVALNPFKFQVSLTYNASSASLKYSFTDNSKTIVECYAGVNGKLDKTTIQKDSIQDIISNANAYFQVFNIKLAGKIDYKTLYANVNAITKNTKLTEAQADTAGAAAINKSMVLVLIYADSQQKIAQAEFYPSTRTYTYYDYYDRPYTETDSYIDIRFIFTDKSKGDLKTYFRTGFQDLVNDINNFIAKINTDFDGNIQPIVYNSK